MTLPSLIRNLVFKIRELDNCTNKNQISNDYANIIIFYIQFNKFNLEGKQIMSHNIIF